ncbi:uncharacterized protein LOC131990995 [Centropristis striata]|uniref:uncharacterized protein LOC131990995 n=1 Tax=Centropristis striata TaxID=184440 RepID=UPI0027E1D59A|nr:uncharacterized protein LOC131990995 [Centropristis striata]
MISGLAALVLLGTVYLIQTAEVSQQMSLTEAEVGGNVTLYCPVSGMDDNFFFWYKQSPGQMVQTVASGLHGKSTVSEQFSRFTATKEDDQYFLTIINISKEDEATYFCQTVSGYLSSFVSVTFLAVNDGNHQKSFYVKQSPETEMVQQGDPVTLQCSLLSKNKENTDQCPAEHSVYWFRSGPGASHPGLLYTHSDEQEERSCVHSLSKTIQNSSDTGTYYCAVVTCGQILKTQTSVQLNTVCTGSDLDQEHLIQASFTPTVMNKRKEVVSTVCPKLSRTPLILGLTTALWSHVDRSWLVKELEWRQDAIVIQDQNWIQLSLFLESCWPAV